MKKKYQVFVSSTYSDLIIERQSSVQAILRAGHIPAGMELFSAGNKSQLDTIKKWIEESDIYMLILGGRYGTIEPDSNLSYTEVEYKYALELGKPLFALIIDDSMMNDKVQREGMNVLELENQDKFKAFKNFVLSKVCRFCNNDSEIKLAILESIIDIQNQFELIGWVRSNEIPNNSALLNEIEILRAEKDELDTKVKGLESLTKIANKSEVIGDFKFEEIYKVLSIKKILLPKYISKKEETIETNALILFTSNVQYFTTGLSIFHTDDIVQFLISNVVPILLNFELIDRKSFKNSSGGYYEKFIISSLGNKFLSILEMRKIKKQ